MKRGQTPQRGAGLQSWQINQLSFAFIKGPGLCTAAQDTRAIHCSQQNVLGGSLSPP